MDQKESFILILSAFLAILLLCTGFIVILVIYRNRRLLHYKETTVLNETHQKELLEALLESQLQTMQHIGSEIHDNVGQKLTLASLYSKQYTGDSDAGSSKERLNMIGNIIDESLTELRRLSKTLTNPLSGGLLQMLEEEAKRINLSGIYCLVVGKTGDEKNLSTAQKNIIFRLLQEFIQNSIKHSGCRNIIVELLTEKDKLHITASDDGKGFDPELASTGIGLQNMKRRASQLNADYSLKSEPAKGTILTLKISLQK